MASSQEIDNLKKSHYDIIMWAVLTQRLSRLPELFKDFQNAVKACGEEDFDADAYFQDETKDCSSSDLMILAASMRNLRALQALVYRGHPLGKVWQNAVARPSSVRIEEIVDFLAQQQPRALNGAAKAERKKGNHMLADYIDYAVQSSNNMFADAKP